MKYNLFFLCCFLFFLFSCKSTQNVKAEKIVGKWNITSLNKARAIKGITDFDAGEPRLVENFEMTFKSDHTYTTKKDGKYGMFGEGGFWTFNDEKNTITIHGKKKIEDSDHVIFNVEMPTKQDLSFINYEEYESGENTVISKTTIILKRDDE